MSERARIIAWWLYVALVVIIFESVFQLAGFLYGLGAALISIALLGLILRIVVARFSRRA